MSETATTYAARAHARAQEGSVVETQPTVPSTSLSDPPAGVEARDVLWEETIGAGGYAARVLPAGSRLRIVDLEGDTCVALVLHRADRPIERLCIPDTVKLQWQAYPGPGYLLLSDMGRVLASMVEDTAGRHDTFCGTSLPGEVEARYGSDAHGGALRSGRERLLLALAKHGLGERDLPPPVNLFKGVRIEPDGAITFLPDASRPGAHVLLRAELDLLVSVAAVPHRLDPRPAYRAGKVRLTAWRGRPADTDDPARNATPEARRAFENTAEELALGLSSLAFRGGAR
ncbi:urea amidolyase associated protein UAAP1 [Sorangium sp. So ce131]|uniref:urea amidolyase associated protein UAAP1 n=1 Tax=Sorangium sp. So ce131 TaxID=3133282 RepID=UPI003F5D68B9